MSRRVALTVAGFALTVSVSASLAPPVSAEPPPTPGPSGATATAEVTSTGSATPVPTSSGSATTTTVPPTTRPTTSRPTSSPTRTGRTGPSSTVSGRPSSAGPSTVTTPTPTPTSRRRDDDGPLTPDEVRRQLAQAQQLAAALQAADAETARATERLRQVSQELAGALQQLAEARQTEAAAARNRRLHERRLARSQVAVADQRDQLGRWARETYRRGGPLATYQTWLTLLSAPGTADASFDLEIIHRAGQEAGRSLVRLQDAASAEADASRSAAYEAARATAARARAAAAANRIKALQQQAGLASAQLRARQARLTGQSPTDAGSGPGSPACPGRSTAGYPNGSIPRAALCPLADAPGQWLRADAAAAFQTLSGRFEAEFGRPICVTDSYRTLAAQVELAARKPALAARPGTSDHGWGTALDLCGGAESFGTAQHAWLAAHAPLTGWFHPSWAAATGTKPEPWHWAFGGR